MIRPLVVEHPASSKRHYSFGGVTLEASNIMLTKKPAA